MLLHSGHITACYSRHDSDIHLIHRRLGPESDHVKTARIILSAQRTCTRFVKFLTLALIAFPATVLSKDDRTDFAQEKTTGSPIQDHESGHLCRGRRIHMSGHFDCGIFINFGASSIFTWVLADTTSAACASQPGNLGMISMTFAAVIICDADETCSVNTA